MMKPDPHTYQQISAALDELERDERLCAADHFIERIEALDFLELMEDMEQRSNADAERLAQRVKMLKQRFDEANERLFAQLLVGIRANDRSMLKEVFSQAEQRLSTGSDEDNVGYDELDVLVNGLLEVGLAPEDPQEREPDMIFYQPTPARIILELIHQLHPVADDLFFDLGSGLGHVPILVNLLADIRTTGVEIEDAYFRYSTDCLKKLGLADVEFIHADARQVAYDDGTIFYLYTPFQGEILRQVLGQLEALSKRRPIRVCAYGPCTLPVSQQKWLEAAYQAGKAEGSLAIFASR
jgi:histone methylation protein DOT1